MVQIIQLVPSSENGQFFAWVVVEGIMLKIPITVPRVFYLNSKAPVTEEFLGRHVNKILPHGRRSYNLYEVCLVLWLLKLQYWSFYQIFSYERYLRFNFFSSLMNF